MSSGSYFPPPARRVDIPKPNGRIRSFGIPTAKDRIAQMVVKRRLEPNVEPYFRYAIFKLKEDRQPEEIEIFKRKKLIKTI